MWRQTDVEKNPRENRVLILDFRSSYSSFSSPSLFFFSVFIGSYVFLVLLLQVPFLFVLGFFVFFHGFLSSSCFFYSRGDCSSSSSMGHFVFFSSSISDLLLSSSNSSSYSMKLESLRLEFHVAKISPCQQSILSLWGLISSKNWSFKYLRY